MRLNKSKKFFKEDSNRNTIPETSCGMIVFRDTPRGRLYLLLKHTGGHVDFPKGHHERGETYLQTALRELEEETGLHKVDFIEGFFERLSYLYMRDNQKYFKQVFFFLGQTCQDQIKISDEHLGFLWLTFEQALKKITFSNSKKLLSKADSFLN